MLASGSPWSARRVGHKLLEEIASKVIRTYWSIASFQSLYARANDWAPGMPPAQGVSTERTALDRWAIARAHEVTLEVTESFESFDPARAGKALAAFLDDLSNWYVRRSRRRFWEGDPAALGTLHECLQSATLLMAPMIPFVTDEVWSALFAESTGVESVHLASWPTIDAASGTVDTDLLTQVALVRRLVELGRAARAEAKVKTRQPLGRALISAPGWADLPTDLRDQVAEELNVRELATLTSAGEIIDVVVKPNFRTLGKRFGGETKAWAEKIVQADAAAIAASFSSGGTAAIDGETFGPDELIVSESPVSGWAAMSSGPDTVALGPRDHAGATPDRHCSRHRAHSAAGPQGRRAGRHRPDRRALAGGWIGRRGRRDSRTHRDHRRRGAGNVVRRDRTGFGGADRAHRGRRGTGAVGLASEGLTHARMCRSVERAVTSGAPVDRSHSRGVVCHARISRHVDTSDLTRRRLESGSAVCVLSVEGARPVRDRAARTSSQSGYFGPRRAAHRVAS